MSRPWNTMLPDVESVKRFSIRSKVDFPAPDLPMIPIMVGLSTNKLAESTARFWPKDFVRLLILSTSPPRVFAGVMTGFALSFVSAL